MARIPLLVRKTPNGRHRSSDEPEQQQPALVDSCRKNCRKHVENDVDERNIFALINISNLSFTFIIHQYDC